MNGNRLLRSGNLLCTIIFILIFAQKSFAQSSPDDDIHISAIAEFYALHTYPHLKGHKALAVGPGGYWADDYAKASAAAASKSALSGCTRALRQSTYKSLAKRSCVLFDVDGKLTGKATPTGIPFGTAATGPDLPYEKGGKWEPTGTPHRGTLVLLHGCNKMDGISGMVRSWIGFYRASGFRVVMPDYFAEPRDPEMCGHPGENGIDAQTRNLKLRVAQTLRTLATLRRKYPGEPLYLHGHSEGGYVVQALGEKVAGIIVTGSPCGFGYASAYWVGEGTPLLVIAGAKDPFIYKARNAKELAAHCKTVRGKGVLKTVSVPDMGHFATIWWPGVRDAVGKFLDVPPITVSRRDPKGVAIPDLPPTEAERYRAGANPKALAAHENGAWAANTAAESNLDAEEAALFECDEYSGADAFQTPSHVHNCVLVDVNGERLGK